MNPKIFITGVFWVALLLPGGQAEETLSARQLYKVAQEAEQSGEYLKAISIYTGLVKRFPQDPRLRYRLAQARVAAREGRPTSTLEDPLKRVVIPSVAFEEADLESIFAFLRQKTAELSDGNVKLNFIYKGSVQERTEPRVSLSLSHAPVTEIIRYVGELTNTVFEYEAHAVVGTPRRMAIPRVPSAPSANQPDPFA